MGRPSRPIEVRLWEKVNKSDGCWLWTGNTNGTGYGTIASGPKKDFRQLYVHRLSYELHYGPIPEGLPIDHICKVRLCVRPDHLEAVTTAENNRRMHRDKVVCKNGHPWIEENAYRNGGHRQYKPCKLDWQRKKRAND